MKQHSRFMLLLLITVAVATGCKKNHEPQAPAGTTYKLNLVIMSQFKNDRLKIEVDGNTVFNKLVTNNTAGLSGSTSVQEQAGPHTIRIVLNSFVIETAVVTLTNDLNMGIGYNTETQKLHYRFQQAPFVFD